MQGSVALLNRSSLLPSTWSHSFLHTGNMIALGETLHIFLTSFHDYSNETSLFASLPACVEMIQLMVFSEYLRTVCAMNSAISDALMNVENMPRRRVGVRPLSGWAVPGRGDTLQ